MTSRVKITLSKYEPSPVEVHRLYIGKYPPSDQHTVLMPGDSLSVVVWPGNEILIREPDTE